VAQWFNPSAPRIKSGEINPAEFDEQVALQLMLNDPLLIRRPLMHVDSELRVGFEAKEIDTWIGLNDTRPKDEEACPICHRSEPCPAPETAP
jgi:nitrogenase-associated protein